MKEGNDECIGSCKSIAVSYRPWPGQIAVRGTRLLASSRFRVIVGPGDDDNGVVVQGRVQIIRSSCDHFP